MAAETRNVGVGGAFIATPLAQGIGTELSIELLLPTTEQAFALRGVVRWTTSSGMGVAFLGVPADVIAELNDYFAALAGS